MSILIKHNNKRFIFKSIQNINLKTYTGEKSHNQINVKYNVNLKNKTKYTIWHQVSHNLCSAASHLYKGKKRVWSGFTTLLKTGFHSASLRTAALVSLN